VRLSGRRWQVWRSPDDQPRWARPALLGIAAFAAALFTWNIATAGYAMFYSDSVKSMSVSWKAWLFGAMDPGATITLDKIPGSFAVQALFARVLGFHQWSVALPQCIEGVVAVLVMYRIVRRWAGEAAGLIAAATLALTPVCASMFGHPMEDGALVCCLVLAADRFQVAVLEGRLRPLVWAGVWVGVGFQMKMMQAWMVLPAFTLAYLLVAPGRFRRRPYVDGSTNNSAVAMVFGYNGLDRFGIHIKGAAAGIGGGGGARGGQGRFEAPPGAAGSAGSPGFSSGASGPQGSNGPGSLPSFPSGGTPSGSGALPGGSGAAPGGSQASGGSGLPGTTGTQGSGGFPGTPGGQGGPGGQAARGFPGGPGGPGGSSKWTKLFEGRFAPQIGWLLPFALMVLVLGLWWRRRAERTDALRGGFVTFGAWLVVVGAVFSDMDSIPHTAYMATLAPALAALSGAGAVMLWRTYRAGRRAAWALPAVVAVQAWWTWHLWGQAPSFVPWLRLLSLLAAAAAVVVLVAGRLTRRARARVITAALLVGLATAFTGSAAWSLSVFDPADGGSAFDAQAGPATAGGGFQGRFPGGAAPGGSGGGEGAQAGRGPGAGGGGMTAQATWTSDERKLWAYVKAHQDGAEYPLTTVGWRQAEPYILATGEKVLPIGGFSGSADQPTLAAFESLVGQGKVHYVLTEGSGAGVGVRGGTGTASAAIGTWVTGHCTKVSASAYGVQQPTSSATPAGGFGGGSGTLLRCDPTS
jgi:4-amino-4-deoxy-L-arabinose transferase-like glycosyltransferase